MLDLKPSRSPVTTIVVAVLTVALATAGRWALDPALGPRVPYIFYLPAIAATAWLVGVHGGAIAIALSTLAAAFFFVEPRGSLAVADPGDMLALLSFLLSGSALIAFAHAVTRAQRAAAADAAQARAHEERFRSIAENMPGLIYLGRPDGSCEYVNPQFLELTGMSAEQAAGLGYADAVHPDDREELARCWYASRESRQPFSLRNRLRRHDGEWRWFWSHTRPLAPETGDGDIARWISACIDIHALVEAEERLRAAEQRFHIALANAPITIATLDRELRYTWVANPLPEYPPEAVLGKRPDEVAPSGVVGELLELERRAVELGESGRCLVRWTRGDGAAWHEVSVQPLRGADGAIVGVATAALDLTAVKRAERAMRASEERLRLAVAGAELGMWEWSLKTSQVQWSEQQERIYGMAPGSFRGTFDAYLECVHPDDLGAVRDFAVKQIASLEPFEITHRIVRGDGEVRWVSQRGRVYVVDGTPDHVSGVTMDVTERHRASEALARRTEELAEINERLELAQRAGRAGVFDWYMPDDRAVWSDSLAALFGVVPQDLAGTFEDFARRIVPEDLTKVLATIDDAVVRHMSEVSYEFRAVLPDGRHRWLQGHSRIRYDEQRRAVRMTGIHVDVDELRQTLGALEEASRRKDEFLAMLAHELRNPLAPIRNAVHVLELMGPKDESLARAGSIIARQVTHMARLVDDLLDASRITRGLIKLKMEPVVVADVIDEAVEACRPAIEQHGHSLGLSVADRVVRVAGDHARLVQVIANLLSNAAKFTPRGGHVTLTMSCTERDVVVQVRDTGVGIPGDMQHAVFDLFVQEDSTLARTQGGLGIGLTLVKRLVELHGGEVAVESSGRNKGSEFVVTLPRLDAPLEQDEPPQDEGMPSNERLRILVVEDNRDSAESFQMLLALAGHDVRIAYDGIEALGIVNGFEPHVAFVDIGLPGIDGFELARRLQKEPGAAQTLLVAVTGYGRDEDQRQAEEAGFARHLTKPVDFQVVSALLSALGSPALVAQERGSKLVH